MFLSKLKKYDKNLLTKLHLGTHIKSLLILKEGHKSIALYSIINLYVVITAY